MHETYTVDKIEYTKNQLLKIVLTHDTSSQLLDLLARSNETDEYIKTFVARHPNTGAKTLVYLLKYDAVEMMGAIAEHPNTSPEILELMVRSSDKFYTQYKLAQNPHTPSEALEELLEEVDSEEIKLAIAQNTNTASTTLASLFDESTLISIEARKNYDYKQLLHE